MCESILSGSRTPEGSLLKNLFKCSISAAPYTNSDKRDLSSSCRNLTTFSNISAQPAQIFAPRTQRPALCAIQLHPQRPSQRKLSHPATNNPLTMQLSCILRSITSANFRPTLHTQNAPLHNQPKINPKRKKSVPPGTLFLLLNNDYHLDFRLRNHALQHIRRLVQCFLLTIAQRHGD